MFLPNLMLDVLLSLAASPWNGTDSRVEVKGTNPKPSTLDPKPETRTKTQHDEKQGKLGIVADGYTQSELWVLRLHSCRA